MFVCVCNKEAHDQVEKEKRNCGFPWPFLFLVEIQSLLKKYWCDINFYKGTWQRSLSIKFLMSFWFYNKLRMRLDDSFYLWYSDYFPYLYCYIHNVSANVPFGIFQVFLVKLKSLHVEFEEIHTTLNQNLYLILLDLKICKDGKSITTQIKNKRKIGCILFNEILSCCYKQNEKRNSNEFRR